MLKVCPCCCTAHDAESGFHANRSTADGRSYYCKNCTANRRARPWFDPTNVFQSCRVCGDVKSLHDFDRHGSTYLGVTARCTVCRMRAQAEQIRLRLSAFDEIESQVEAWLHDADRD